MDARGGAVEEPAPVSRARVMVGWPLVRVVEAPWPWRGARPVLAQDLERRVARDEGQPLHRL
jgi:hypothetical protein